MTEQLEILFAVDAATLDLTDDDQILATALAERGLDARPHRWGHPVEPGATVVIRSTWDYIEQPDRFTAWLDHLDDRAARVHNPTATMRWNLSKHYLVDLSHRGVAVVPIVAVGRGTDISLPALMAEHGWTDAVVKPAIGGTARLAARSLGADVDPLQRHLDSILATEDAVVQPFVPSITTDGETSIVAISGEPCLAVIKRPAPGDWRSQTDFGGSATRTALTAEHVEFATTLLHVLDDVPTFARVDVVRSDDGALALLELELVEPELFFRIDRSLADRLADHLARSVQDQR